jgi:hypothetical protein
MLSCTGHKHKITASYFKHKHIKNGKPVNNSLEPLRHYDLKFCRRNAFFGVCKSNSENFGNKAKSTGGEVETALI